jgi:chromate transport protein ChrA
MGIPKGREFRKRWGIKIAVVYFVWAPVFVVLAIVMVAGHHHNTVLFWFFLAAAIVSVLNGFSMLYRTRREQQGGESPTI